MTRNYRLLCGGVLLAALGLVAGCGDNSAACGDGTMLDDNGFCVPTATCGPGTVADTSTGQCVPDGSVVCTDGTKFDPASGTCVIDPDSCQDGTVLIGGKCVDPTAGLTVDLEEGAEPNGAGIIESSAAPAGIISALKPVGGGSFVIHGHITPFQDDNGDGQTDPDVDTYGFQVNGPTLLQITVDGVHGIDGGFVTVAAVGQTDPLASWLRFGLNITGDTAKRQVFLPKAGTYAIAVADTRSLYQYATGGPVDAAPGDANSDYYVSIDQLAIPTPTALTVTNGVATQTGTIGADEVQFYTTTMGSGFNDVSLAAPASQVVASAPVLDGSTFRVLADASAAGGTAETIVANFADTPVVVVDNIYNTANAPVDFTLTIATSDASALSTTGATVSQPETSNAPQSITEFNQFYYDVTSTDQVLGMNLQWNHPVYGVLLDHNGFIFSSFTLDPDFGAFVGSFQSYAGLLRHAAPGRYYFVVFDPDTTNAGTNLSATSTITALTPTAVDLGTPSGAQDVGTFGQAPFTFDSTASDWDSFDATGTGTNQINVMFFDPESAYRRLGELQVTCTNNFLCGTGTVTFGPEAQPLFSTTHPETGSPQGRIVISQPTRKYFGTATASSGTGTIVLNFAQRVYHDFGTVADGTSATVTGEDASMDHYYLLKANLSSGLEITTNPSGVVDTSIQLLNDDESANGAAFNNGAIALSDMADTTVTHWPTPYVAWKVTSTVSALNGTYDITTSVTPGTYLAASTSTSYSDACSGGTVQALDGDNDEGLTAPISTPAGFTYFGSAETQLVASTNGWLSFDTSVTDPAYTNASMPDSGDPNGVIAPFWTDLDQVTICTKTVGSKLVVQWTGALYQTATAVQFQAILDPSDNSIEFVYGSNQQSTGEISTIGIENQAGDTAVQFGFYSPGVAPAGSSMKLTPN